MKTLSLRWGVTGLQAGVRRRLPIVNPRWSTASKAEAFDFARQCCDASTDPRIVRLTTKGPRVVSRLSFQSSITRCLTGLIQLDKAEDRWLNDRIGKRVRIILEELADD